jgi:hypothetical protein
MAAIFPRDISFSEQGGGLDQLRFFKEEGAANAAEYFNSLLD